MTIQSMTPQQPTYSRRNFAVVKIGAIAKPKTQLEGNRRFHSTMPHVTYGFEY